MVIAPEVGHGFDCSPLGNQLFYDAKLDHRDITLSKKHLLNEEMNGMARFHERFEKLHYLGFRG